MINNSLVAHGNTFSDWSRKCAFLLCVKSERAAGWLLVHISANSSGPALKSLSRAGAINKATNGKASEDAGLSDISLVGCCIWSKWHYLSTNAQSSTRGITPLGDYMRRNARGASLQIQCWNLEDIFDTLLSRNFEFRATNQCEQGICIGIHIEFHVARIARNLGFHYRASGRD